MLARGEDRRKAAFTAGWPGNVAVRGEAVLGGHHPPRCLPKVQAPAGLSYRNVFRVLIVRATGNTGCNLCAKRVFFSRGWADRPCTRGSLNMATQSLTPENTPVDRSLITYTNIVYALHAFGVAMGVLSTATTVLGGFVFSLPSIVAVILNYAKRSAVRGTWLDSHFGWQIRTFWYAFLWMAILFVFSALLAIIFVGFAIWYVGALLLGAWVIYRVARGWLNLRDRIPMS
jgi:uncharacterized membrane protein